MEKYRCITKTRAQQQYRVSEKELASLPHLKRPNPHYKCASPMLLYRLDQVLDLVLDREMSDSVEIEHENGN